MKRKIILFITLILISCSPVVKYPSILTGTEQNPHQQLMTEYLIQPGDQLDVRFYNNPELNEQITVRPDGRISTQLAPEIMAANKTPAELSRMMIQAYSSELRDPRITVIVRTFASSKIYVGGEVGRPGIIDLVGSMTVLQSVAGAGGFLDTARKNEIVVIRKAEKRPLILTADISRVIDGSDLKQDLNLKPYDVVFVPKSPIANVNVWVDQYVRKLIPIPFGFGFGFDL